MDIKHRAGQTTLRLHLADARRLLDASHLIRLAGANVTFFAKYPMSGEKIADAIADFVDAYTSEESQEKLRKQDAEVPPPGVETAGVDKKGVGSPGTELEFAL